MLVIDKAAKMIEDDYPERCPCCYRKNSNPQRKYITPIIITIVITLLIIVKLVIVKIGIILLVIVKIGIILLVIVKIGIILLVIVKIIVL